MQPAEYRPLRLHPLKPAAACRQPNSYNPASLETPAMEVMTDFLAVPPVTIGPGATLTQATNAMVCHGIRFLFVVDAEDSIIGVITARDTTGEKPVKLTRERGGKHGDLRVEDLMTRHENVEALALADVQHAEVGHILETLKEVGRQHAIVTETDATGREFVRGIFSATAIGRRLGVPVTTFEVAKTFAEIVAALGH